MMTNFEYYMPVKLYVGENIVANKSQLFAKFGKKAMIVTGKHSARANGSLTDCLKVLEENKREYLIFDEVEENPSLETVAKAAQIGRENKIDFCIGIGGGSPLDAAKAIGLMILNREITTEDLLKKSGLISIPLLAIPTTAGTGSETTPYSVLTIHQKQTKQSIPQKVFFEAAFLDAKYMLDMPRDITVNTAIDALTHIIESYLCVNAYEFNDMLCETGFSMFGKVKRNLEAFDLDFEQREKLLLVSSLAGMCIAQTGTSLPHGMGYPLTYFKGLAHGAANGVIIAEYLRYCDMGKVSRLLAILGFRDIDEFGAFLKRILRIRLALTQEEITKYTSDFMANKNKLKAHPFPVGYEDILNIYKKSLCE